MGGGDIAAVEGGVAQEALEQAAKQRDESDIILCSGIQGYTQVQLYKDTLKVKINDGNIEEFLEIRSLDAIEIRKPQQ